MKEPIDLIYSIHRSRRRSLSIKVVQGEVRVNAPHGLAEHEIQQFVSAKANWINRHLARQQQQLSKLAERLWENGETLQYLGETYPLWVHLGAKQSHCEFNDNGFQVALSNRVKQPQKNTQKLVEDCYKALAKQWLDHFIHSWQVAELQPSSHDIASFSGKWGSCSATRAIRMSWRLWLAPEYVVRYVVIHELCHLKHFNHSKAFWQLVEQHDPNYLAAEAWLKRHGITVLNPHYTAFAN